MKPFGKIFAGSDDARQFPAVQKRLAFFYTLTTGLILSVILLICFFYMQRAVESKNNALFSSLFLNISSRLQSESFFSDSWLAKMEADNSLIISIEDNGTPLHFRGSWEPDTDRDTLITLGKQAAAKSGVPDTTPGASQIQQSSVFSISGEAKDSYTGMYLVEFTDQGFKSLLVLKEVTGLKRQLLFQGLFFLLADITGIFLLFLASWNIVGKTLLPLKENQKKQAEFIAAASHELRSPLAVIQASASAARTSPKNAAPMLSNIEKECSRMGTLIQDLLLLAAADSRRWNFSKELCDGDTLLLDVYETFEPLCRQKKTVLHLELPDAELPRIFCDKNRVIQILTVLLDNALSYTEEGGIINLSVFSHSRYVYYSVADHGKGIPDSEKPFIFDRFYQNSRARDQKEHFGLGLSIARELAKLHKGDLYLKDTPGGGCTFLLAIPVTRNKTGKSGGENIS